KPCVATAIEPNREVIGNEQLGVLVEPCSAESIADGVIELLSDPEQARAIGQRAREMVLRKFTVDQAARKLEAVYTQVLVGR
ncbi:MAG: glycosyltransferase, partial [Dehalococcoidia bacterium]